MTPQQGLFDIVPGLPPGWTHRMLPVPGAAERLEQLPEPLAVILIEKPGDSILAPGPAAQRVVPSLELHVYPQSSKAEILRVIDATEESSRRPPILYAETRAHVLVTTPERINSGIYTPEAEAFRKELDDVLEPYLASLAAR